MTWGWIGYLVGCENESTYRVWYLELHAVRRIAYASVHDGVGLEDEQRTMGFGPPANFNDDKDLSKSSSSDQYSGTVS
jgi:hypothetical protein